MGTLLQDVRYGLRMLAKNPGFTAVAVLTLALGIGANTAIFSVVNGVLLAPLPYPNSNRLMGIVSVDQKLNGYVDVSPGDFADVERQEHSFSSIATYHDWLPMTLAGRGAPESLNDVYVSPELFRVLDARPALGRAFLREEGQPGKDNVVLISHSLWERRFGGKPGTVGQAITLDKKPFLIVGVMPVGFSFPRPKIDIWVPLSLSAKDKEDRGSRNSNVLARLKPGVRLKQAQAEVQTIARRLASTYPDDKGWSLEVVPLKTMVVGNVQTPLLLLLGAVGFVLLIACINMANLTLARGASRQSEVAVREALGASRWRVTRQLLTESLMLAAAGGSLGLAFAPWGIQLIKAIAPSDTPRLDNVAVDLPVLWFALGASLVSGILFGLAPAIRGSKLDLVNSLKQGSTGSGTGYGREHARSVLVTLEVALALVLLIGAGLLLRSFWQLISVNPGFSTSNILSLELSRPMAGPHAPPHRDQLFSQQVVDRVAALRGVSSAAASNMSFFSGTMSTEFDIEGRPTPRGHSSPDAQIQIVSPGFFRTLGIPLIKGRDFTEDDNWQNPNVFIINQALARRFWPSQDPLEKRIKAGWSGLGKWGEIIGIVGDTRDVDLGSHAKPEIYACYLQGGVLGGMNLVIRTASDPLALLPAVRGRIWGVDKDQPVTEVMTLQQAVAISVADPRFYTVLLGAFAALALALASVGIYGMMSYAVTQRTHEIGIRMALGAERRDVLKLVVGQGLKLTLIAVGIGIAGGLALTRFLSSLLYGVKPTDPLTFIVVSLILAGVALLANYIPARRATKVDPIVALRYE